MKLLFNKILLVILNIIATPIFFAFTPYQKILDTEDQKTHELIQLEQCVKNNDQSLIIEKIEQQKLIDSIYFNIKNKSFEDILQKYKEQIIEQTNEFFDNNDNISVSKILNNAHKYFLNDQTINNLIKLNNQILSQQESVEYTGEIEHLTFNTLMAFPEKALSSNNNFCNTYDAEKLTTNEFLAILNELYKNNYIIIDIFDAINNNNQLTPNKLILPENKKPIILSFDNVSYKSNYQNLGEIDKIIIDRNNNLATYTTKKSIQDRIQYNNEFIVILENFINDHPDFSHNNARGIIFLTGENGILGYNTCHKNANNKYESKRASEVVKKLKSLGWRFGCNNYTYKNEDTKSDLDFAKELSLWNKEVKTIIGDTILYAHPYGDSPSNNTTKQELLFANNFKIFFKNSFTNKIKFQGDCCIMNRKEINGHTLRNNSAELEHLFSTEKVYDHINRSIAYYNNSTQ